MNEQDFSFLVTRELYEKSKYFHAVSIAGLLTQALSIVVYLRVNTAARMESTGIRGKIQLSQNTAELLSSAGKSNWVYPREEAVTAKGKGTMNTYWLHTQKSKSVTADVNTIGRVCFSGKSIQQSDKVVRLIGWMSEVLIDYVKQIVSYLGGYNKCYITAFSG